MNKPSVVISLAALCLFGMAGIGFGAYHAGQSDQRLKDQLTIAASERAVHNATDQMVRANTNLIPMEKELDQWHGLFPGGVTQAQQQMQQMNSKAADLQQRNEYAVGAIRDAYQKLNVCTYEETQVIAQARQAQQAQGMSAALKILALLLH